MLVILVIAGLILIGVSFATWQRPAMIGFDGTSDTWQTLRGLFFALWALALPAYAMWEWYSLKAPPANMPAFTYEHKVWTDVWTAVALVLGVFFGVKK